MYNLFESKKYYWEPINTISTKGAVAYNVVREISAVNGEITFWEPLSSNWTLPFVLTNKNSSNGVIEIISAYWFNDARKSIGSAVVTEVGSLIHKSWKFPN